MSVHSREILSRLERKVVAALERRDRAHSEFSANIKATTGIPHTCASLAVRNSSREYREAIRAAERAMNEHSDYVLHGKIPDDIDCEIYDCSMRS